MLRVQDASRGESTGSEKTKRPKPVNKEMEWRETAEKEISCAELQKVLQRNGALSTEHLCRNQNLMPKGKHKRWSLSMKRNKFHIPNYTDYINYSNYAFNSCITVISQNLPKLLQTLTSDLLSKEGNFSDPIEVLSNGYW